MEPIKTDVVVLGAGPGGYAAAFYAADKGRKVTLIEKEKRLGGVCLNCGCIPSKALLHATEILNEAKHSATRGITFGEPKVELQKAKAFRRHCRHRQQTRCERHAWPRLFRGFPHPSRRDPWRPAIR
ncbi:MAG: hypothetical protein DMG78_31135 [Acidobacteria bacterium]|nr:MAG: hypothetical protein DMG78_31135 [Acidobacteriota bacterium]